MLSKRTKIILNLFVPQEKKPNPKYNIPDEDKKLNNKVIVITGGTDGIGKATVEMLYNMGAEIILIARNKTKSESLINQLNSRNGNGKIKFKELDQSFGELIEKILVK